MLSPQSIVTGTRGLLYYACPCQGAKAGRRSAAWSSNLKASFDFNIQLPAIPDCGLFPEPPTATTEKPQTPVSQNQLYLSNAVDQPRPPNTSSYNALSYNPQHNLRMVHNPTQQPSPYAC
jgi:hypothetical protein